MQGIIDIYNSLLNATITTWSCHLNIHIIQKYAELSAVSFNKKRIIHVFNILCAWLIFKAPQILETFIFSLFVTLVRSRQLQIQ